MDGAGGERVELPGTLWRVVYREGFGWPELTYTERTQRTYDDPARASRMVATIEALPSHHALLGVWRTPTEWVAVDVHTGA